MNRFFFLINYYDAEDHNLSESCNMEISEFTLKLILLLIPGAIASLIFVKLTTHTKWNTFKFLAHSILFGALSYLSAILVCASDPALQSFWSNLPVNAIPYSAIFKASLSSVPIGFLSAAIDNYKLINQLGMKLKISKKYGYERILVAIERRSN